MNNKIDSLPQYLTQTVTNKENQELIKFYNKTLTFYKKNFTKSDIIKTLIEIHANIFDKIPNTTLNSSKNILHPEPVKGAACNFIKKETLAQVFSCEFCEISKNTFHKTRLGDCFFSK